MSRISPFLLSSLLTVPALVCGATPDKAVLAAQVDAYLEPLLKQDLISGSLLIAKGGEILVSKGFGPADREHGALNTPSTKFRIGSLTKQFTAAGILLLEQRGKLKVDDPLSKYLPDFPNAEGITLLQLLSHTSGLANYNSLPDYWTKNSQPLSLKEVIAWFKDQPRIGKPGEKWFYSNSGYALLTAIIEKVSGKPYIAFMRDEFFLPLGMKDTGMDVYTEILGKRAEGYGRDENGVRRAAYRDMPFMTGGGSLYSTVEDLFRWDRALRSNKPLGEAAKVRLFAPVKDGYACGWFVEQRFGKKLITHGGDINGFRADMQRYVDEDLTVIALLNFDSTFTRNVFRSLGGIALGEPVQPALKPEGIPIAPQALAELSGTYRFDAQNTLTLSVKEGQLRVDATGMPSASGIPQTEKWFFIPSWNGMLGIQRGQDGKVASAVLIQGSQTIPAKRIP